MQSVITEAQVSAPARRAAGRLGAMCLFAALVAVGSHIRIPIPGNPIPFTLQLVFVLLAGAFLSPAAAAGSMLLFIAAGLLGVPVFAGGGAGAVYLSGPTGGYLVGFVAGAAVCSALLQGRRAGFARTLLAMAAGLGSIHLLGALHLGWYVGGDLALAVRLGVAPFLMLDVVKLIGAASFVSGASLLFARDRAGGA